MTHVHGNLETTRGNIDRMYDLMNKDLQMTIRYIAIEVGISYERVQHIQATGHIITKDSAHWLPCLLTAGQKRTRFIMYYDNMNLYEKNPYNL